MINFIKKWWFLRMLGKAITLHTTKNSIESLMMGKTVLLAQGFFIVGNEDYPGLIYKTLRWRINGRKKDDSEELKKMLIHEYNDIFKVCVEEGFVKMTETQKGFMPSTATSKAFKISGIMGLLEALLSEYKSVWTTVFIPIITFILGLFWKKIF